MDFLVVVQSIRDTAISVVMIMIVLMMMIMEMCTAKTEVKQSDH